MKKFALSLLLMIMVTCAGCEVPEYKYPYLEGTVIDTFSVQNMNGGTYTVVRFDDGRNIEFIFNPGVVIPKNTFIHICYATDSNGRPYIHHVEPAPSREKDGTTDVSNNGPGSGIQGK
jgi:hypothetical protein